MCREVCWRKLAGTEDPPSHSTESTEDRPARRLQVDDSIGALWASAADNKFIRPTLKRKEDEDLAPKDFMHGSTLEGTPEERLSFLRYGMGVEC